MEILQTRRGNSDDTIKAMKKAVLMGLNNPRSLKIISQIPNNEKEIFLFAFNHIHYFPDEDKKQTVRTFQRSYREGIGNCVDYSVFLATILTAKNIKCWFKRISENGRGYNHVYIITEKSIMDCVQGQNQEGLEYLKEPHERTPKFNREVKGYKKYLIDKVL